jgi:hypothetical protein
MCVQLVEGSRPGSSHRCARKASGGSRKFCTGALLLLQGQNFSICCIDTNKVFLENYVYFHKVLKCFGAYQHIHFKYLLHFNVTVYLKL